MDNDWNITQRLVRIKVCSKSDNGNQLAQVLNLGQYVSMALKQEIEQIKQELEMPGQVGLTRDISAIFYGSTRQGEAIVIIV